MNSFTKSDCHLFQSSIFKFVSNLLGRDIDRLRGTTVLHFLRCNNKRILMDEIFIPMANIRDKPIFQSRDLQKFYFFSLSKHTHKHTYTLFCKMTLAQLYNPQTQMKAPDYFLSLGNVLSNET